MSYIKRASPEDSLPQVKHMSQLPTLTVFLLCAPNRAMKGRTQFSQAGRGGDTCIQWLWHQCKIKARSWRWQVKGVQGQSDFRDYILGSEAGLGWENVSSWAPGEGRGQVLARKGCRVQVHITRACCFFRRAEYGAGWVEESVGCGWGWCNTFWFWCLKRPRYQSQKLKRISGRGF